MLIVIAVGLVVGYFVWRSNVDAVEDYAGAGDTEVVVRIQGGDTPADIAQTLADAGVVASTEAFEAQAAKDGDVQALRPGYYKVRQNSSAQAAADALVAKENQVGRVRLIPGRQLADVTATSTDPAQPATVVPGYISEITAAACVPLNGQQDCFTTEELWRVAETADPAMLGVVEWAADHVLAAPDPRKRLEGVILPRGLRHSPRLHRRAGAAGRRQRLRGGVEPHRHRGRRRANSASRRTRPPPSRRSSSGRASSPTCPRLRPSSTTGSPCR